MVKREHHGQVEAAGTAERSYRRRERQPQPSKGGGGRQASSTTDASKVHASAAPFGNEC